MAWPARGQKAPNYWDSQVKAYIDTADATLQTQINDIEASDVETVAGVSPTSGDVLEADLFAALEPTLSATYVKPLQPSGDTTGVTDTAAIQANEDAGRDTLLVAGQTYWVKGLVKKSYTHIYFNGATMQLPHGANDDVIVGQNFATLTDTATNGGIHDFGIHGPGFIHGSRFWATTVVPTTLSASFNMSASFSLQLSSTTDFAPTGTATVNTLSGPQTFTWSANDTATGTLTCSSTKTGRVLIGSKVFRQGYGIRLYGYNFDIGDDLMIHECLVDGLWTEWAPTIAVGSGTVEMESRVRDVKVYENSRNGYSYLGPHDSMVKNVVAFKNAHKGIITANASIGYFSQCHAWGSPQIIGIEDHTGSTWVDCVGEMTSASGSRGWGIWSNQTVTRACIALWSGSGGNVGLEIENNASGCDIDMKFVGGFGNGAVKFTNDGGGNVIRGIANSLGANPMIAGTPAATDVIDLIPGVSTTTERYTQNLVPPPATLGSRMLTVGFDDGADYNVSDYASDDLAVAAALAALPFTGGGLLLKAGTFDFAANVAVPDYSLVSGEGMGTVVRWATGAAPADGTYLFTVDDYSIVQNMRLDGNSATNGNGGGIYIFEGARVWLNKLYVASFGKDGIRFKGTDADHSAHANKFTDIDIRDCGRYGIYGEGAFTYDSQFDNVWIGVCNVGLKMDSGDGFASNLHVWGCVSDGIQGAQNIKFGTVYSESNGGWGINATGSLGGLSIAGGNIWKNGLGGVLLDTGTDRSAITGLVVRENVGPGMEIRSDFNQVTGCTFFDLQGTKTQTRPVIITGSAASNNVSDCAGRGTDHLTGTFASTSSALSNVFENCIGLNPRGFSSLGSRDGSATVTFDRRDAETFYATLTGNWGTVVLQNAAGLTRGMAMTLVLTQDATGGRTITWPSNFKPAGGALVINPTPDAVSIVRMVLDANGDWQEVSRSVPAQPKVVVGTSATASGTAAKTATIAGYTPTTGDVLALTLTNGSNVAAPTLSINGGGALSIAIAGNTGSTASNMVVAANGVLLLYYSGSRWEAFGPQFSHGTMSQATAEAGTSTNAEWVTALRIRQNVAAATLPTSTTAALAAIGNAANTTGKYAGKTYYNTTTKKLVTADGSTAAAVWVDATGATAHTPV